MFEPASCHGGKCLNEFGGDGVILCDASRATWGL